MFNRIKKTERTGGDIFLLKTQDDIQQAKLSLEGAVRKVIICIGCIDLYPNGADKDLAKQDAEKAKYILLNAIAIYDDCLQKYKAELKIYPKEERTITSSWVDTRFSSSHEIIEFFYEKFYNK
jgi:hypothetical protein